MSTKISIISTNLSSNATNRCLRLAQALQADYRVEIVGPAFEADSGNALWAPLKDVEIPIRWVRGDNLPGFFSPMRTLLGMLDGDLIIACKPRFPSYGLALIKRALSGTPVILDVDDDELAMTAPSKDLPLHKKLTRTHGYFYTQRMIQMRHRADAVFTVSENFRADYGGVIVPHGMNPQELDPARFERMSVRSELDLRDDDIVVGFIGTPSAHKGVDLILAAMERVAQPHLRLMLVGAPEGDGYCQQLQLRYGDKVKLVPPQPLARLPYFLAAADLVILPQRNSAETFGQMPAKLTDAMAMAKPIIAAERSDIGKYLQQRGLVFQADNLDELTERLRWFLAHRGEATRLGLAARAYFLQHLTLDAMRRAMQPDIERLLAARR